MIVSLPAVRVLLLVGLMGEVQMAQLWGGRVLVLNGGAAEGFQGLRKLLALTGNGAMCERPHSLAAFTSASALCV